jgi:hypothetical protein
MNMAMLDHSVFECRKTADYGAISTFDSYWMALPKYQGLPQFSDFRPEQVATVTPLLMVKKVLRDPLDFEFRLVGSRIVAEFGRDFSNLRFSEIDGYGCDSDVWESNEFVVEDRTISTMHIPYTGKSSDLWQTRQSSYPFSETGVGVDYVVTVIEFHPVNLSNGIGDARWPISLT